MNYSYVMGISNDISELKAFDFNIKKDNNNYMVSFKDKNKEVWEKFICQYLDKCFWNEYIGDSIVFIFKFKDGSIKKYILDSNNQKEILKLCSEFAETNFKSIKSMLLGNKFYKEKNVVLENLLDD